MTTQIITTKFFVPSPTPNLVSRSRLLRRLERGLTGKLTLISAQAGSGKSTLLSEWTGQCDRTVCWLSLDERDNNPHRFLNYFISALQKVSSELGGNALSEIQTPQSLDSEFLLTGLINEITRIAKLFVIILDDYHVITEPEIQQMLLFLLDHQPPTMHLIISSRADPPWPLSRFRARGEILEVRSQEMRFTLEEAAEFLNDRMGLALSPEDIAALESRTEGWIAGLQLAALSIRNRTDKNSFVGALAESNRYVMDYLVEEILDQQQPEVRKFLLKTSILERLSGSLCDALLGEQTGQAVLTDLEQKNLFLIPLDDQRRWYRYHHLFADLLRHHLQKNYAVDLPALHERASAWYEENDLLADALNHALAAKDIDRIVQLTDKLTVYKLDRGESKALLNWLERLPEFPIVQYPWLLVARTWALFNLGKYEAVEDSLAEIEVLLASQKLPGELKTRIQGHTAAIRSYLAELREDPQSAMQQAENALAWLPDKDIHLKSFVAIRWANCLAWFGELNRAIQAYQQAGESSKHIGEGQLAITALSEMSVIQMIAGNLRQALRSIYEINQYAESLAKRDGRRPSAMGILYRHLCSIKRELNELAEAEQYAVEAIKICKSWGEKESHLFALMAQARVQFAQGEDEQVEQSFRQIIQIAGEISPHYVAQFTTWIILYQLLMGELSEVERWVQDLDLKPGVAFGYDRQLEYYNYARYLFAREDYPQALEVVDDLLKVVNLAGAGIYTIRYRTLQSLILLKLDREEDAMIAMEDALSSARSEGYVRSILDEGEAVGGALRTAIAQGIEVDYAGQLLRAHQREPKRSPSQRTQAVGLVDPLSERELEVLRLLVTDLSTIEISNELFISVSTVRSHIKQIYSKLDAHSRFEAVSRARELKLL